MYERYFKLADRPFSVAPNADYLYLSNNHRRALSLLEYGVTSQTGFSVITGEIGAGKTTILQYIIKKFSQNSLIINVTDTKYFSKNVDAWLLHWFGYDHEETSDIAYRQKVISFFKEIKDQQKTCVLIIDEAQYLSADAVEHLRLLANMNEEGQEYFKLILVGQPELRSMLEAPRLKSFAQRISASFHLNSLTATDTRGYIRHRVSIAEENQQNLLNWHLFDDDACDLIYLATKGVPRSINILCDMALVYAYSDEKPFVDRDVVRAVLQDRISGSTLDSDMELTRRLVDDTEESLRALRNEAAASASPGQPQTRNGQAVGSVADSRVSTQQAQRAATADSSRSDNDTALRPKRPAVAPARAVASDAVQHKQTEPRASANGSAAAKAVKTPKSNSSAKKKSGTSQRKRAATRKKPTVSQNTAPKPTPEAATRPAAGPKPVQRVGAKSGKALLEERLKWPPPVSNVNSAKRPSETASDETLVLQTQDDIATPQNARLSSFGEFRIEPVDTAGAVRGRRSWGLVILMLTTLLLSIAAILALFEGWQYVIDMWRGLVDS